MTRDIVLVTGAAGFIGGHLCEYLLQRGVPTIGVDNVNDYYDPKIKESTISLLSNHTEFEFFRTDVRDFESMESIIGNNDVGTLVHLAAMAGVRSSIENPGKYLDVNVNGTNNMLQLSVDNEVDNFIYASSSSVYGERQEVPFHEEDRTDKPVSPYAASKKASEVLAYSYHSLYDIPVSCLRFFTVYGPRGRPDMAPFIFIHRISKGIPIKQYGDGTSLRDYTYVSDIVQGINGAIENPRGYEIYNLGNADPVSLTEFIHIVEDAVGKRAEIEVVGEQPGDVHKTYADYTKAKKHLGYEPKIPLREGISRMVDWYNDTYGS
ncbi:MAG: SDR family NAD(P)-dependent oxidoreductase [Candidatus Thorarchaeota archaeon]